MRPSGKNWQSDRSVMMECTGSVYTEQSVYSVAGCTAENHN